MPAGVGEDEAGQETEEEDTTENALLAFSRFVSNWNPDQPRDKQGRWASEGGDSTPSASKTERAATVSTAPAPSSSARDPGDRPRRPAGGFSSTSELLEHARKMVESHHADPHIRGLKERLAAAQTQLDSLRQAPLASLPADDALRLQQSEEQANRLQAALSHEARRSMVMAFMLPVEERARVRGDVARPQSPQGQAWEKASMYLDGLLHKDGPGHQWVSVRAARGRAYYNLGTIYTGKSDDASISCHELGHHIEQNEWVYERAQAFHDRRFKASDNVSLREKFPEAGYRKEEVGNPDDMKNLFGDDNTAAYCGKTYPGSRHTEIVSMGMEQLYKDPVHFAHADPDYFGLIMSILQEKRK